ncbi:MAG: hypothetical protein PGN13_13910 [Patulibacter minatonensis]
MFLNRHARPFALVLGTSLAITLTAGSADAAPGKSTTSKTSVTASTAKAKSKSKSKKRGKAKGQGRPDLATKGLHVDVSEDGTLLVDASLLNLGRKVAGPSTVVIALSDDATFDDDDEVLSEIDAPALGAGVKRAVSDEVEVPGDLDTSEEFTILVCADGYGVVNEANETNNCVSQALVLDDLGGDDSADDASSDDSSGAADDGSSSDDGQG